MTWHWQLADGTLTVWDHTGSKVHTGSNPSPINHDHPQTVLDIMRESADGSQPSAYNQQLLLDAVTGNIEQGTPPE